MFRLHLMTYTARDAVSRTRKNSRQILRSATLPSSQGPATPPGFNREGLQEEG